MTPSGGKERVAAAIRDEVVDDVARRIEAFIRHGEAVPDDVTQYDRDAVHNDLRILIADLRAHWERA